MRMPAARACPGGGHPNDAGAYSLLAIVAAVVLRRTGLLARVRLLLAGVLARLVLVLLLALLLFALLLLTLLVGILVLIVHFQKVSTLATTAGMTAVTEQTTPAAA
jgi:hypothetical protein